ncbi:hypothetical protein G6L37_05525 [Agrobacterium rubi]|nr:hypothetical protein [Agrobacterium rubi]NTF24818.1 hypothetical protein [Agrobacterium rubi]
MVIDDIMDHVRRSHPQIEKALLAARREVAADLGRSDHHSLRLSTSEVARAVRPFTFNFFERYPEYSDVDHATRTSIIRKLDKLNVCMFMLQFPERMQDVIQQFRFENRLASEESEELAFVYGPLLRALDRAATSGANLKEALPFLKRLAADTLGRLPRHSDAQAQRSLMEIIEYAVHTLPVMETRREVVQAPSIDTVHERPANDNDLAAPMRMR